MKSLSKAITDYLEVGEYERKLAANTLKEGCKHGRRLTYIFSPQLFFQL